MPYSIYILPEGLMTVTGTTGGSGLDGQSQGSGVHMQGATIRLNSNDWVQIDINDDDTAFSDNDSNQTTAAEYTLPTSSSDPTEIQTFPAGTRVEAEYGIVVEDSDGIQYQLVAFNFSTGSPSYGTIEGLAFIGPQGGFPPIGEDLRVISAQEGPSFQSPTYATPICFAMGTRIATPGGDIAVEDLRVGDLVWTAEKGAEPIRWIGRRRFRAEGRFAPVRFAPGAIGNARPLLVSRQHRLLVSGWRAELLYGADSVWVPAVSFLGSDGVSLAEGGDVTYFHLLLDGHRTLRAEGVDAESLHPGDLAMGALDVAQLQEIEALFPEMLDFGTHATAYPALRAVEARAMVSA